MYALWYVFFCDGLSIHLSEWMKNTVKRLYFAGYIFHESLAKFDFAKTIFMKTARRGENLHGEVGGGAR